MGHAQAAACNDLGGVLEDAQGGATDGAGEGGGAHLHLGGRDKDNGAVRGAARLQCSELLEVAGLLLEAVEPVAGKVEATRKAA